MKVAAWVAVVLSAAVLAAYPFALGPWNPIAVMLGAAGLGAVVVTVAVGKPWPATLSVGLFVLQYLMMLMAAGLAFDAFVLIEAVFALLLLEALDLLVLTRRVREVDARAIKGRLRFVGSAGGLGAVIAVGSVALGSVLPRDNDPRIFAAGAVAVAMAGATVVFVSSRRVLASRSGSEERITEAT